jgi:hypothetical protein
MPAVSSPPDTSLVVAALVDPFLGHYATAKTLNIARQTVLAFAARGMLTPHRVGGRLFFLRDEVERLRGELAVERRRRSRRVKR